MATTGVGARMKVEESAAAVEGGTGEMVNFSNAKSVEQETLLYLRQLLLFASCCRTSGFIGAHPFFYSTEEWNGFPVK